MGKGANGATGRADGSKETRLLGLLCNLAQPICQAQHWVQVGRQDPNRILSLTSGQLLDSDFPLWVKRKHLPRATLVLCTWRSIDFVPSILPAQS